jgi:hypothetical protein
MAKYRSNPTQTKSVSTKSNSNDALSPAEAKEEKKFFQIAIIVTLLVIGIIYYALN